MVVQKGYDTINLYVCLVCIGERTTKAQARGKNDDDLSRDTK